MNDEPKSAVEPMKRTGKISIDPTSEHDAGGAGNKEKAPAKVGGESDESQPPPLEDDDFEDGDFATPRQDHHGDDDQPL